MSADEILPPVPSGPEPSKRKRQRKPASDEQLEEGFGVNQRGEDKFRIRYQRPDVAEHCARVLIQNNMDYEAAVTKMLQAAAKSNGWEMPTDEAIIRHAALLKKAPQVQNAL